MVITLSYFTGVIWLIICDLSYEYMRDDYEQGLTNQKFFIIEFNLDQYTNLEVMIKAQYYMLTSLSTVGFGDYNPKSDVERIACGFVLLIGIIIFNMFISYGKMYIQDF